MDLQRWVILWRRRCTVIRMGVFCSFLTRLAGTLLNALLDRHFDVLGPMDLIRRLIVGYTGSAAVVVLAFPFLSGDPRRRRSDDAT